MMDMHRKFALGIDIGASKTSVSIAYTPGVLADRISRRTVNADVDALLKEIEMMFQELERRNDLSRDDCLGIGVAVAAFVRSNDGTVLFSPNITGLNGTNLKAAIEEHFSIPALVHNDANAGALGEFRHGGHVKDDFLYMTISSGIGGGLILDDRIYEGPNHVAGEIGHMIVQEGGRKCGCGRNGCLETLASGIGIARIAAERVEHTETSLKRHDVIDARAIFQEARQGDRLCMEIVTDACHYIGIAIANAVTLLGLNAVVLGGGIAKEGEFLRSMVEEHSLRYLRGGPNENCKFFISRMPDTVVDIGVLELAFSLS